MGTAIGVFAPIMPMFANEIGINTLQFGLLTSSMALTRLIVNIPAAWATNYFGRRPLLIVGPLVASMAVMGTATAHSFSQLLSWRLLLGIGESLQISGAQTSLTDISTPINRARTIAPMQMCWSAGMALGPIFGGYLGDILTTQQTLIITSALIGIVVTNNWLMCVETKPTTTTAINNTTITNTINTINTINTTTTTTTNNNNNNNNTKINKIYSSKAMNWINEWKPLLQNPQIRSAVYLQSMLSFMTSGLIFTVMPMYAITELGFTTSKLGMIMGEIATINVLLAQPMAWLNDKMDRKKIVLPSIFLLSLPLCALPFAKSFEELVILAGVWSVGRCVLRTTPIAYVADICATQTDKNLYSQSHALALLRSAGDIGTMVGAGVCGAIAHNTSIHWATTCTIAGLIMGGYNFSRRAITKSINK